MTPADLQARFDAAQNVMAEAGTMALEFFARRNELTIDVKGLQDVVSIADQSVEELIRDRLAASFPTDGFVGEEHGAAGDEHACWVIDPIDGTQNFLRGIPYWTVVLAFVVDGRIELGVTVDPVHGETFTARRGQGAWRNGRAIRCRQPQRLDQCCVALSFGFKDDWRRYVEVQGKFLAEGVDMRRLGSTALILAHIADGRLDAIYAPGNQSWDCLAGLLLVQEAGGLVVDFLAENGLLGRGPVVATVPVLRELAERVTAVQLG